MGRKKKNNVDKVINLQTYPRQWEVDILGRQNAAQIGTAAIQIAAKKKLKEAECGQKAH